MASDVTETPLSSEQRETLGKKFAQQLTVGPFSMTVDEVQFIDEIRGGRAITVGRLEALREIHDKYFNPRKEEPPCTNLETLKSPG